MIRKLYYTKEMYVIRCMKDVRIRIDILCIAETYRHLGGVTHRDLNSRIEQPFFSD